MTEEFIRNRITALRIQKDISEYKMSLDLGHSKGYIQSISSGRTMPSMSEFLAICDYLNVTPQDFFNNEITNPELLQKAFDQIKDLSENDLKMITQLAERLNTK